MSPQLRKNFKHVGTQDIESDKEQALYFEDMSANEFTLLLNGRTNLVYANLNLVLCKRHDIAQLLGSALFSTCVDVQRDCLWIEIPIVRDDNIKSEILLTQSNQQDNINKA